MTTPISPQRLAEIRKHAASATTYAEYQRVAGVYVPELLAEVDRLTAELAKAQKLHCDLTAEVEGALARIVELEDEREYRDATTPWGKPETIWAIAGPNGYLMTSVSEQAAREHAAQFGDRGRVALYARRDAWRDANATETTAEGDPA